ncbi:alpha/beta hydrolase fold-3 domain containing protein [Sclerotinia borealis F-4128]|uniref:Alpha/beta hydrolase fold-3 domain containing protein n=1 Tax=Sclerotinia borealis (strain F-4128) TaxID=1432307 RepID=W9CNW9_SCLBF|nr:alpha/beta hydrolase fold-3 domain containing protein [Sclerotinia borealis F-4128]
MDPPPPATRSHQPLKTLYIPIILLRLTLQTLLKSLQPNPHTSRPSTHPTHNQILRTTLLRSLLRHTFTIRYLPSPLSLLPNAEYERFVLIPPSHHPNLYTLDSSSILAIRPHTIKPVTIGGTFYPSPPPLPLSSDSTIILHFHGGAFIYGNGRTRSSGKVAKILGSHLGNYVFFPQYRLAGGKGEDKDKDDCKRRSGEREKGYFPAALQDAVTAYMWLIDAVGFESRNIIISGDGAGGNIAIGLVRWLEEVRLASTSASASAEARGDAGSGMYMPMGCTLWSPCVDLAGLTREGINEHENFKTDYMEGQFMEWAVAEYLGPYPPDDGVGSRGTAASLNRERERLIKGSYVSPLRHPFRTSVAMWIMVGKGEVLYDSIVEFAERMGGVEGNKVGLYEVDNAPHNILLMGSWLGWEEQADETAREAGVWMRKKGWKGSGSWEEMGSLERKRRAREAEEREGNEDGIFD